MDSRVVTPPVKGKKGEATLAILLIKSLNEVPDKGILRPTTRLLRRPAVAVWQSVRRQGVT